MTRKNRIISYIMMGVVAGLLIAGVADMLADLGVFRVLDVKSVGACRAVTGLIGAEDMTVDPETGIAYLSAYDRRSAKRGDAVVGGLYAYDLSAAVPGLVNLTPEADENFLPHGLSLYRGPDGVVALFVINHGSGKHAVEIFNLTPAGAPNGLVHRETIESDALVSPNDLVAVGPRSFYVTNDRGTRPGLMRKAETYLRLRLTNVQYFDGEKFIESVSGVGGANGISVSADGATLYLAAGFEQKLYIYGRDKETGALTKQAEVALAGRPDNIERLDDGSLLVAIHPKALALRNHWNDQALSPSQLVRIKRDEGGYTAQTIYLNKGEAISAATVGATHQGRLVIGSILEPKFLDCRWNHADPAS